MGQDDPIKLPIDGVLDLHTFKPAEAKQLVSDYIGECLERGIRDIRIIHGKGSGTLRTVVRSVLEKDKRVAAFGDADILSGGWGATVVALRNPR
jgi:DNA-nicking Smr family endonuclease